MVTYNSISSGELLQSFRKRKNGRQKEAVLPLGIHWHVSGGWERGNYLPGGIRGVGKTQVAIEYAYRYHFDNISVFWIHAETYHTIMASYQATAFCLDLLNKKSLSVVPSLRHVFLKEGSFVSLLAAA